MAGELTVQVDAEMGIGEDTVLALEPLTAGPVAEVGDEGRVSVPAVEAAVRGDGEVLEIAVLIHGHTAILRTIRKRASPDIMRS